jgi:hypothetical protein
MAGSTSHSIDIVPILRARNGGDVVRARRVERKHYELIIHSLTETGRSVCFPCDADGQVIIECLSRRARLKYLQICPLVGLQYSVPSIRIVDVDLDDALA